MHQRVTSPIYIEILLTPNAKKMKTNRRENSTPAASKQSKSKFDSSESESHSSPAQPGQARRSSRSKGRHRGAPRTSTNVFFNFLMGAGLTSENHQRTASQIEDEPFVFVDALDKFGLYDSTDTEISELRYPVKDTARVTIREPKIKKDVHQTASPDSGSKDFRKDQESGSSSFDARLLPSTVISAEENPDVTVEDKSDHSREISIEDRFVTGSLSTESEASSTSKQKSNPSGESSSVSDKNTTSSQSTHSSEESGYEKTPAEVDNTGKINNQKKTVPQVESNSVSDKNTTSSQSTRSSEESAKASYEKSPAEVDNKGKSKSQRKTVPQDESSQDIYHTGKINSQRKKIPQDESSQDIYHTPKSSPTKVRKETDAIRVSPDPKTKKENIKAKRSDSSSKISIIEEVLGEIDFETNPRKQKATEFEKEPPVGRLKESAKEKLSRLLVSQMSDDRKRGSLDKQNSRFSREPPERDQNYDDSLMKKNYPQSPEIHQGSKPWCSCKNADDCRRLNHQQYARKNYPPEHRKRTTYDLVKSAENLQNRSPCTCAAKSKQGQLSLSSPEVSRNKQNMKSEDPCNADTCEYYGDYAGPPNQMEHVKPPRKYPYEEPLQDGDYNNENHERNCACDHCNRRNRYRNCKCCNCLRNDDHISTYSDDSECNLNLAYQKSEDYPDLVDEIENSISRRNKERVKKTMRQFEMLSRQNKGLEKPIYDDDEEDDNVNRFPCNKRNCPVYNNRPRSREAQYYNNQKPRPPCCYDRRNYQTKSECLSERPAFSATPFPRNRGYVEKVARYMDPSMSETAQKYPRYRPEFSNSRWQMDPRSGEWVKICDDGYDFENNYPPLPAPPAPMYREGGGYRDYENYLKNQGNPNFFNAPNPFRMQGAYKRSNTPTKQCQCRNCMQPSNNCNRY